MFSRHSRLEYEQRLSNSISLLSSIRTFPECQYMCKIVMDQFRIMQQLQVECKFLPEICVIMTREMELFEPKLATAERECQILFEMEKDKDYIAEGILSREGYTLSPSHCEGLCIDIPRGSTSDNVKVCLWNRHSATNQLFQFIPYRNQAHPSCFLIQNLNSGKYLGVQKGKTKAGSFIMQTNDDVSLADNHWTLQPTGNGKFCIQSAHSELTLDVYEGGKKPGSELCLWHNKKQLNQQFSLQRSPDEMASTKARRNIAEKSF
uniref:Ricin B lectin domain-containing protein n=1 Tax=Entamoeba invadens TaxID=33085 RepID=S0B1B3_ENTIV|nr:hypothetical protein [Entamoeba invadens]